VAWIGTTGPNTHDEPVWVDPSLEEFVIPSWYRYDQVAVIVTNGPNGGALDSQGLRYTVSAVEQGEPVIDVAWRDSQAWLRVTNPSRSGAALRYRSSGAAQRTQLVIYDARGRLVQRLVDRVLPPGEYGLYWNGASETGARAATGVYTAVLRHDGGAVPRKFILIR
jgi:hypothetical protein